MADVAGGRDLTGERLGPYRLEAAAGRGAFGRRYRARHVALDSPRVVEVREWAGRDQRFLEAARTAALLAESDGATVLDFGAEGELEYVVTDPAAPGALAEHPVGAVAAPDEPAGLPEPYARHVAAAVVAVLVGAGIVTGVVHAAQPPPPPAPAQRRAVGPTPGVLGSPMRVAGLTVTVFSVDTGATPPSSVPLDGAHRFVTVLVQCRDGSGGRVPVSPYDWVVSDAEGRVYDPVVDGLGDALPERTIGPGQSMRGQVGFVVPRSARGLLLHFDAEQGDGSARLPLA